MSDAGRKDISDKIGDTVKPDSQKSTTEQIGDRVSGSYDSAAKALQPQGNKSDTQKATDKLTGAGSGSKKEGEGFLDKTKDTLGLNK